MDIFALLNLRIMDETLENWLIGLGVLTGVVLLQLLIKKALVTQMEKWGAKRTPPVDGLIASVLRQTGFFSIIAVGLWFALFFIEPPLAVRSTILVLVKTALFVQIALWGTALINYTVNKKARAEIETSPAAVTSMNMIGLISKVVLWSVIVMLVLENVTGIEVNSLIASLGIAGVAVALAVQNVLGDLFASVSIAIDQPFVIGDFIIVDSLAGTVEHIGLKSTRMRSVTGEQLIFSNSDLLASRIRNFKRMARRRMLIYLNIPYGTSLEMVKLVPEVVEKAITNMPDVTFERAHLMALADYALRYEVVCFVETADYQIYMDRQQETIQRIYGRFGELGIEFALPMQAVTPKEGNEPA